MVYYSKKKWKKNKSFSVCILPIHESVSDWSFNILMSFSSAINCKVQGIFKPFSSSCLTGFQQTTAVQSLFSLAFTKKNLIFTNFSDFPNGK